MRACPACNTSFDDALAHCPACGGTRSAVVADGARGSAKPPPPTDPPPPDPALTIGRGGYLWAYLLAGLGCGFAGLRATAKTDGGHPGTTRITVLFAAGIGVLAIAILHGLDHLRRRRERS
jgi:hypothetical protein